MVRRDSIPPRRQKNGVAIHPGKPIRHRPAPLRSRRRKSFLILFSPASRNNFRGSSWFLPRPESADSTTCWRPATSKPPSRHAEPPVPPDTIVGVGIMVAHNPLHGSGRAALLHPALALGNNAKALPRIRVTNVSLRDPASHSALHLSPGYTGFLATALKHPPPEPSHGHAKVTDRHRIHRHRVIAHISENHRAHILPHCGNRRVHASPEFGFDFLEFALPSLAHRLPQHHESSLTGLRAAVSETQKVKGLG